MLQNVSPSVTQGLSEGDLVRVVWDDAAHWLDEPHESRLSEDYIPVETVGWITAFGARGLWLASERCPGDFEDRLVTRVPAAMIVAIERLVAVS